VIADLKRRWRLVRALFGSTIALYAEYRAEMAIWVLAGSLPLVMMFAWIGIARERPVGGYDAAGFVAYFLTVFFVRQMTPVWVLGEVDRAIRKGELSPMLLRPLHPFWVHAVGHLSAVIYRVPPIALFVLAALWGGGALDRLDWANLPLFALAIAGAWTILFNFHYSFGLLAFWTDQAGALQTLIYTLNMIFGGGLVPLGLFPAPLRAALLYTPFRAVIDFPASLMAGRPGGHEILLGFALQLAWILLFVGARRLLWRLGLRRYAAAGA
jgi:ABC-2 type transport system permease protein